MRIAVPKETLPGERRVAIVPETVKRLAAKKIETSVQAGAGAEAYASDDEYKSLGATIEPTRESLFAAADVVVKIRIPTPDEILALKEGSTLVSLLLPLVNLDLVRKLAERKITAIAVDMIPRTTLAQMMDVLSSQATVAGYQAVLRAAGLLPKFFPM